MQIFVKALREEADGIEHTIFKFVQASALVPFSVTSLIFSGKKNCSQSVEISQMGFPV